MIALSLTLLATLVGTPSDPLPRVPRAVVRAAAPAVRSQPSSLDVAALARGEERPTQSLELFDGRRTTARLTRFERTRPGGFTWLGTLDSDPTGYAAFAVQDEAVVGVVLERGVLYRVRNGSGGIPTLQEQPAHELHGCDTREPRGLTPLTPLTPGPATAGAPAESTAPAPAIQGLRGRPAAPQPYVYVQPVTDLLIVWTQEAQDAAGGASAIQALVDLAVLETNMILDNSDVRMDVRLVHSALVGYTEASDMAVDLDRLHVVDDGYLDGVHALRDQYGADAVSLFEADDSACGRSYNMSTVSAAFAPYAFSVISQGCATGEYALAHELGHTFGLDHDRLNAHGTPSHPFAYGFWLANGVYRTVMALPRWGVTGVRIPHYSNPDQLYLNQHFLGVPPPSNQSSDCSGAIDLNTGVIVNWRPTEVP